MAIRRTSTAVALSNNNAPAPTAVAVMAATPAPALVTAPDAMVFLQQYENQVGKWAGFQVSDDTTYVKAAQGFTEVGAYIDNVENAFEAACSIPYRAWKAMTDLRGMFKNPAELIKSNLASQQIAWRQKKDQERRAEEERLRREAQLKADREREAKRLQLEQEQEAERQRLLAEQDELPPWEQEEVPEATPVLLESIPEADIPEIRLPSTVPAVMGVSTRLKPWMGRCDDFKALVIALGKRAEEGDTKFLDVICINQVRLNQLSKDHTTALQEILPGCVAVQEEGLARR